jgi:hypothetical protein
MTLRIIFSLILVVVFSSFLNSIPPAYGFDLEDGLVAYWSFDNCDARDDSGNGDDGSFMIIQSVWRELKERHLSSRGER